MKTLFKKILVLAVLLGTFTSFANDPSKVTSTFSNVKKGNAISVSDDSGAIIYRGEINTNENLENLFDFTQLKDGKYTIEIDKAFEIELTTIEVKNHVVSFINSNQKKIFKPSFKIEKNRVSISKLALDNEEMKIELYYENELIYSETLKGKQILKRIYKLDENIYGPYAVVIKSNGRVFIKNFSI